MKKNPLYLSFLFLLLSIGVNGQINSLSSDSDAKFKEAQVFYKQAKYSMAYALFKELYLTEVSKIGNPTFQHDQISYYYLLNGLLVKDEAVVSKTETFIQTTINTSYQQILSYQLALYYFEKQDYANALVFFLQSKIENLSNAEIAKLKFSTAYCYFIQNDFKQAKPLFKIIKQIPNDPNYSDANYYYGFISFKENDFTEAINSFKIASSNPSLAGVIPFYLAQIYYLSGEKEKSLSTALEALLNKASPYTLLLEQLVGHMYFERREYEKAIPYLSSFYAKSKEVSRQDLYELAVSFYQTNQFEKAGVELAKLSGQADSLSQNSMYLLATIYIKLGEKEKARTAFQFCANNSSQVYQKEVAIFNFGKLSYELGYSSVALENLNKFISLYPNSEFIGEAKEILVHILANANDYMKALDLYETLLPKTDKLTRIYPGILFGAAVSYFNNSQFEKSDSLLNRLVGVPYHQKYLPAAYFWKGELAYRKKSFTETILYLTNYLSNPLEIGEANIAHANYTLGYAYFNLANFSKAKSRFQLIGDLKDLNSQTLLQDAYLRIADCHFMQKEYAAALSIYQLYLDHSYQGADYACYQKAMILGAKNQQEEKIKLLASIERIYPKSQVLLDANKEIANTYLADENYNAAIPYLQKLISKNNPALITESILKLGIAYFNLNENDKALNQFSLLSTKYPNSEESADAIDYIRNIYIEQQKPEMFTSFMKEIGKPVSISEEDSLLYRSALIRSQNNDKVGAVNGFIKYLAQFPNGNNYLDANYYIANSYYLDKRPLDALPFFQLIADKYQNKYAEESSIMAARILYFQSKNYLDAEKYFSIAKQVSPAPSSVRLEAMKGLLRCQFKRQAWDAALPNAEELLLEKGTALDDKLMAYLVLAKSAFLKNDFESSTKYYKQVVLGSKNEMSAEAQYQLSLIYFNQGQLELAEKNAFHLVKQFGDFEFWVTKGYLLLGDIYFKQADWFNAEATFTSIQSNSSNADFVKEAKEKLANVLIEKQKKSKIEQ